MPKQTFRMLMLSAMYENGGNTTQRMLDGHPDLFVYPFESQLGTRYVNDGLSSVYPPKYRWPEFLTSMDAYAAYKAIIDEEGKVRARTPFVSKFRDADIQLDDDERCEIFCRLIGKKPITRALAVQAFFMASHKAWKNYYAKTVKAYVGYSPVVGIDAQKMVDDGVVVLNVIRNPFSAFADTKKRPVPMSLDAYMTGWVLHQYKALTFSRLYPKQVFIVRFEDMIVNPKEALTPSLKAVGVGSEKLVPAATWNGTTLTEVYPWGTIRVPTSEANLKTAKELSKKEIAAIHARTQDYLKLLGYEKFYSSLLK